ncbi:uncharacterized protein UV8b_07155 [Ustilaginoidea virens]|uniref:CHY-type domain-containing protein n=1 Tax=Ustilaginoidea virens TaxID=1159556 RepID=A0A8E5HWK7_USTVR|nr:uncharacterized protein UV8b_07155 [Ustilaginoidea virens]QUC22914.1 hypothetical protein UV8b_07155 [Ustilaginoidea virens]
MISHTPHPGPPHTRKQAVAAPPPARVVPKPAPPSHERDPRAYQLEQLRRRFSPRESTAADGTSCLLFRLKPSDPDFPFELAHLECEVRVPPGYPAHRPALRVRNGNIPRGFGINIERGWDRLAAEAGGGATLLSVVNALDKRLEKLLSEEKAETVKLVAFRDTRHLGGGAAAGPAAGAKEEGARAAAAAAEARAPAAQQEEPRAAAAAAAAAAEARAPGERYSREQVADAKARRAREIRQIEARMGRLSRFRRSADGVVFTLPVEPKRRGELPPGLCAVDSLDLMVPLLYPLQDLRIQLNGADAADAEPVEELFAALAARQKSATLMSHMNRLVQSLHSLARQAGGSAAGATPKAAEAVAGDACASAAAGPSGGSAGERSHVKVIPRPPEWDCTRDDGDSDSSYSSGDSGGSDDDADADDGSDDGSDDVKPANPSTQATDALGKGTMLSLPGVELRGIEALEVSILGLSVKCDRCKTANDLTNLRPGLANTASCRKCASRLTAAFSPRIVHGRSSRAGFVDLQGCRAADLLPSTFAPTCERCSTAGPGFVSVRGESVTNVCRACHGRFTLRIPEARFLQMTPGSSLPSLPPPPPAGSRARAERLGLRAGEPLPDKGACAHYRRSYRWFRFSCCERVHACDRCHDGREDHASEWAARMICGWCSREQRYRVEACGCCGRSVVGKRGRGFWEGGRGTRDQRQMSRKDGRKHKRLGGKKE